MFLIYKEMGDWRNQSDIARKRAEKKEDKHRSIHFKINNFSVDAGLYVYI